jgi:hypothetical protein
MKAQKSTLAIGDIVLDCYMKPDGSFAFTANQLKSLDILIGDSTGKKYAQPLLIKENPTGEVSKIEGTNASVKLIGLDTFAAIIQAYAVLGNQKCMALCIAAMAESLESRASAAFGLTEKTVIEKNYIMSHRIQRITKEDRLTIFKLWDGIVWERLGEREENCLHPRKYCRMMNELLFGVQNFRLDRDNMTPLQQDAVFAFEEYCVDEYFRNPRQTVNQIFQKAAKWASVVKDTYKIDKVADKEELGKYTPIKEHPNTRKAREIRESEDAEIRAGLELFLAKEDFDEEDLALLEKLANQ